MQSIPDEKMNLRRGGDFWTIAEHVSHLAQVQPMLLERLQRFMAEDRPEFVPYIPGDGEAEARPPQMTANEALDAFARYRAQQLALLEKADEAAWQENRRPSRIRTLYHAHPGKTHPDARLLAHVPHGGALADPGCLSDEIGVVENWSAGVME